jgi:hypothetical protein
MTKTRRSRMRPYVSHSPTLLPTHSDRKSWGELGPGDQVTVHERKELPYEAIVDVLTEDALVVWVIPVLSGSWREFHSCDDVKLVKTPRQQTRPRRGSKPRAAAGSIPS